LDALDPFIVPLLKKEDLKIYENLKICIIPDYEKLKLRHLSHKDEPNTSVANFLDKNKLSFLKKSEYLEQF
jgi:hypothetical protein